MLVPDMIEFKTELDVKQAYYMESHCIIDLLDKMMNARDVLFDQQLEERLGKTSTDLPHQS